MFGKLNIVLSTEKTSQNRHILIQLATISLPQKKKMLSARDSDKNECFTSDVDSELKWASVFCWSRNQVQNYDHGSLIMSHGDR
ncbi:hypothetical protein TNIN_417071 [Trichonephila inaurata madagascariensis]|uniref:Uncharacterized protein n=1 Tax=Trichonephila inaurata madagascariensis TaxID=2747483 RepID=A0A8X6Y190_9ARAC|nr:hypothetical protein TNIN_417071 [Trichonephila inaurata madagascariensis]